MSIDIHGYHHSGGIFFRDVEEGRQRILGSPLSKLLYLGAEVETDTEEDDWNTNELESTLHDCSFMDMFCATEDGSLCNGAEFVSNPATLGYWRSIKSDVVAPGFDALVSAGLRAHQTTSCGLHIHASRSFFSSEEALVALMIIVERNWPSMTVFARRATNHYAQPYFGGKTDATLLKTLKRAKKIEDTGASIRDRYRAVNYCKGITVEFRFFRGTLNVETFYATLEFVDNLCRLANALPLELAAEVSIQDVIRYAVYPELDAYAFARNLMINAEISDGISSDSD